jgi:transcriptional regulator with XRE-family HTH domain
MSRSRRSRGSNTLLDGALRHLGLSNVEVAALCGVTSSAVQLWRAGLRQPTIASAKLIALTYGIPRYLIRPDLWEAPPPAPRKPRLGRRPKTRPKEGDEPDGSSSLSPAA